MRGFGNVVKTPGVIPAAAIAFLGTGSAALAGGLLKDGQTVRLTITSGTNPGKYDHTYEEAKGTFNSTSGRQVAVIAHDAVSFTFRGPRATCTLTADGRVACDTLGSGYWKVR
jgi:hypothetical protein